jgi:hypothetical protein
MNIFKKISQMQISAFVITVAAAITYTGTIFTALNSNAEAVVSPGSYVTTGENVQVVKGQPEYVNGEKVAYKTVHSIPIKAKIETSNGSSVAVPGKLQCNSKAGHCGKKLMAD